MLHAHAVLSLGVVALLIICFILTGYLSDRYGGFAPPMYLLGAFNVLAGLMIIGASCFGLNGEVTGGVGYALLLFLQSSGFASPCEQCTDRSIDCSVPGSQPHARAPR